MSKNKRKTTAEKLAILKEAKAKGAVETVLKHGIFYPTYLDWKNKYYSGGEKSLGGQYCFIKEYYYSKTLISFNF